MSIRASEREDLFERARGKDVTNSMFLEDIYDRDNDNFNLIWKDCEPLLFDDKRFALFSMTQLLTKILSKLGVYVNEAACQATSPLFHPYLKPFHNAQIVSDDIDGQFIRQDVRMESRKYLDDEDVIRSGLYVYHKNEIVYVISWPVKIKRKMVQGKMFHRTFGKQEAVRYVIFTNFK